MASKLWLTSTPADAHFNFTADPLDFATQLTACRVISALKTRVTALYLSPSVLVRHDIGAAVKLVPVISSLFQQLAIPSTKTLVYVAADINYQLPLHPGIVYSDSIRREDGTPHVVFMSRLMAEEAARFGTGLIYCIIKNGPCIDDDVEPLLKKLSKAMKAPRFERVIIISNEKSSASDIKQTKGVFRGFDFTYAEYDY